jgi:hypothetical protein
MMGALPVPWTLSVVYHGYVEAFAAGQGPWIRFCEGVSLAL